MSSARAGRTPGGARLVVERLSVGTDEPFGTELEEISFEARAGEILGIAGVAGNGQKELMLALSGETAAPTSRHSPRRCRDRKLAAARTAQARPLRLARGAKRPRRRRHLQPRREHAADRTRAQGTEREGGDQDAARMRDYARRVIDAFKVATTGADAPARSLSGGNLQKFVVGREILQEPQVLVVDQPTWGVDAGAAAAIRQALVDLAARGSAVILVSQDLDELLSLCDRLYVMNEGRAFAPAHRRRSLDRGDRLAHGRRARANRGSSREGRAMRIRLEPRKAPSRLALYGAPVAAIALTMLAGTVLFTLMGFRGGTAVFEIFVEPLLEPQRWPDIAVKASPLVMIATGLAIGFRANVWNIGAEGQYIVGAIAGTGVALATYDVESRLGPSAHADRFHHRRRGLGRDPGNLAHSPQGQRDPDEPHAHLCGPSAPLLSRSWALA